ncbi:MAG: Ig-like domain repeat protein [Acidobacteriaceae bacterium]
MAVEIQAYFRRMARTTTWVLAGVLSLCGVAGAQAPPVTTGSIIPLPHPLYNQIYKFAYWHGYVVALDTAASILYQMSPGQTTFTQIYSGTQTTPMGGSGSYWTEDMTIDNEGNLWLPQRYGTPPLFWRVPFDPVAKTWTVTTNDGWPAGGATVETSTGASLTSQGSSTLAFLDDGTGTGGGTLFWMTEVSPFVIYQVAVGAGGTLGGAALPVVSSLMNNDGKMSVDANGNIFFVENPGASDSGRVNGAFFIAGGTTGAVGETDPSVTNLIPSSYASGNKFNGATLDAAGNLYLTSESDGYGGTFDGDFMIPNTCGSSQADVYVATCYNWSNASYISPIGANNPLTVDPRGFLWIPHYGDYSFPGSATYGGPDNTTLSFCAGGACNFVLWARGSDNLGASPVGTASSAGTVFVNFNAAETLGNIVVSQPGTGTDFATNASNPYPDSSTTTPTQACTTATTNPYAPMTSCPVWVAMTPRTVGAISGKLTLQDSTNATISGSTTYLSGTGQGPLAALLGIPTQTAMAAGLSTPAQVAVDTLGNVYVADPGLGKVLEFAAGSSGATGTSIGTGLTAPTGVAVDGAGDVYIGDSGKIIEIPFVNGALNAAGQKTLVKSDSDVSLPMPLGHHLNLAVDGQGDVYVADSDNAQVVEVLNPVAAVSQNAYAVVGAGFTSPSAVAVDNSGDVFVADGSNLYEITPWSSQSLIDSALSGPVTGLAAEPSGSVVIAQQGGILRIPSLSGSFTVNDAAAVDTAVTAPNGVAIDNQGNLYVTDMTGGTPNLFEVNTTTSTAFDFGQVGAFIPVEQDVAVFNVGNEPLSFSANPTFSDTNDFSLVSPDSGACDTTGTTPVGTGASCNFGVQLDAQATGPIAGSMTVASSAVNGTQTANFTATSLLTLEPTAATISLSPTTATFPGSTTATVTITQAPLPGYSPSTNVPDGPVTVTLTSTVQGSSQPPIVFTGTASGTDTSTTATINLTGLPGGSYNVKGAYKGNTNYGGSTATTTLVVAPAPPAIAVSEPSAIQPDQFNGVYYVAQSSTSTITATVTSPLGTPTGSVTFMNGSQPADPAQINQPLDANGQVTFSLQNLPVGTYSITAVYSGDSNFATFTSAPVAFQVLQPSVLLSASPTSVTTPAGTPVSASITLESLVNFSAQAQGDINITCDNSTLPQYSECTFSNPQPQLCPPPGDPDTNCMPTTTTVVTISTNIPVNVGSLPSESPFVLAGVLGLGLFGLGLRKKRLISRGLFNVVCLTLLLAGAVAGFTGCTNSGYTHTPPAPHYVTPSGTSNVSIIVTDASSGQQYSLPFTLPLTVTSSSK